MTTCPIALAVGCKSCLFVNVCLLRSVVGDYGQESNISTEDVEDPLESIRPVANEHTEQEDWGDEDPLG